MWEVDLDIGVVLSNNGGDNTGVSVSVNKRSVVMIGVSSAELCFVRSVGAG